MTYCSILHRFIKIPPPHPHHPTLLIRSPCHVTSPPVLSSSTRPIWFFVFFFHVFRFVSRRRRAVYANVDVLKQPPPVPNRSATLPVTGSTGLLHQRASESSSESEHQTPVGGGVRKDKRSGVLSSLFRKKKATNLWARVGPPLRGGRGKSVVTTTATTSGGTTTRYDRAARAGAVMWRLPYRL